MSQLPQNSVSQADLAEWYKLQDELAKIKTKEMLLRTKIFKFCFPTAEEGVNDYQLPDDYVLKGTRKIQRDVDIGSLNALKKEFNEQQIPVDSLIRWKPELVVKEYRTLTDEQRLFFDQALIIKDSAPSLEIVLPKKRGRGKSNEGDNHS